MPADLWSFTLDFYARPGVEQACLHLQDHGADVCVVLCGVWLGQDGVQFCPSRAQAVRQMAVSWQQEVVMPLRALRIQWRDKATTDADLAILRGQVKALELNAERTLLERLQVLTADWSRGQAQDMKAWLQALAGQDRDAQQVLYVAAHAQGSQA